MADSQSKLMHIRSLSAQVLLTGDEADENICVRSLGSNFYQMVFSMPVL